MVASFDLEISNFLVLIVEVIFFQAKFGFLKDLVIALSTFVRRAEQVSVQICMDVPLFRVLNKFYIWLVQLIGFLKLFIALGLALWNRFKVFLGAFLPKFILLLANELIEEKPEIRPQILIHALFVLRLEIELADVAHDFNVKSRL